MFGYSAEDLVLRGIAAPFLPMLVAAGVGGVWLFVIGKFWPIVRINGTEITLDPDITEARHILSK